MASGLRPGRRMSPTPVLVEAGGRRGGGLRGRTPVKSSGEESYTQWKNLVPIIYDWFSNNSLVWPSLSCRWGPLLEQDAFSIHQRLYLSEQTDGSVPNTLVISNAEVVKPRVATTDHISKHNEEKEITSIKKVKSIIHPGEVNRIRELPQNSNIVATHTDSPEVLVWNVETQPPHQPVFGAAHSSPDLILTGHQENAEFALAMCTMEPFILSGGKDKCVLLWSIEDHMSVVGASSCNTNACITPSAKPGVIAKGPSVEPRCIFQGHEDTVEDVQFCPSSAQEFCSVGDDSYLIFWDARSGSNPVLKVEKAHDADLHCVDWSPHDSSFILTGSADNSISMFDRRKPTSSDGIGSPVYNFEGHDAPVLSVQWSPVKPSVFGSSAEDGFLNIWDYEKVDKMEESLMGLFFQHCGHGDKIVDFHWNQLEPWTIVSVSDDCNTSGGGGTLQIWRMSDLLYRPEDEVLAELENFQSHVISCNSASPR